MPRPIRVFISSPFLDLHSEREELVKRVFPALQESCDERGLTCIEVDLRWGITDAQVSDGEMLGICLDEIDDCRPYFIGLLGDHYGSEIQGVEPAMLQRHPWLADHIGESVTEIEMFHGALAAPEAAARALFYFRTSHNGDPSPSRERVQSLKDRITASGLTVREWSGPVENLGDLVRRDLDALVREDYPDRPPPGALESQIAHQQDVVHAQAELHVGRADELAVIGGYLEAGGPPLVVTGPSGIGKSALLATTALRWLDAIVHFTSASPSSTDWAVLCRQVLSRLIDEYDLSADIPENPDALRDAFAKALRDASGRSRVVLVLDGLDQLDDHEGALDLSWLPQPLPERVRVIASALPSRALDEMRRRGYREVEVGRLEPAHRAEIARRYLGQYGKSLAAAEMDDLITARQTENPLFLRLLLGELRVHGAHDTVHQRLTALLSEPDAAALLASIFHRWEADYERGRPGLVATALRSLRAARSGLSESELLDLLGSPGQPLPHAVWAPLRRASKSVVADRGGRLIFAHPQARDATTTRYVGRTGDIDAADHRRLAAYFADLPPRHPRRLEEQPWQLLAAADFAGLHRLLVDVDFAEPLYEARPFEYRELWTALEAQSSHRLADAFGEIVSNPLAYPLRQAWFVARLFLNTDYATNAEAIYRYVEDSARSAGDEPLLVQVLRDRAIALERLGRLDPALAAMRDNEAICRRRADDAGLRMVLNNQVSVLAKKGLWDEAERIVHEHRQLCEQAGDEAGLLQAYVGEAMVLQRSAQYARADDALRQAERLALERGDLDDLQIVLGNRAACFQGRGRIDEAFELLARQEAICRRSGDARSIARLLGSRAIALRQRGDLIGACSAHDEQEAICRERGFDDQLQAALGDHGVIVMALGDHDTAMTMFIEQEAICRRVGLKSGLARSYGLQALIHDLRGASGRALELHRTEAEIFRELGETSELIRAFDNQARVHRERGELAEAMPHHAEVRQLCALIDSPSVLARACGNEAETRRLMGDQTGAERLYREQLAISDELSDPNGQRTAWSGLALVAHDQGDDSSALDLSRKASAAARELGIFDVETRELAFQGDILFDQAEFAEAHAAYVGQAEVAREHGQPAPLALALFNRAKILLMTGQQVPRPLVVEALELARAHGLINLEEAAAEFLVVLDSLA
ncbi:AAA family ATPase [Jatrophihabitans sp. GAS493]|uniref:AAA family ATPase n=1 Tax=Jatrophihabitans sp. GAS493 TaxID=1907575 RepID=UPI0015603783|nr:AAA family ATPase [Jatrophihabitans sp. GAS493]